MFKIAYSIAATSAVAASALGVTYVAKSLQKNNQTPHESKITDLKSETPSTGHFKIKLPVGTLKVETGGVSQIEVHADRTSKTPLTDNGRRWLQNSKLVLRTENGSVILQDFPMGEESYKNFKGDFNGSLDVTVRVPAGLDVDIEDGAGTINGRGDYRTFSLHLGAGEVDANLNSCPSKNSELHVGAGEVKLHLPARANADVMASVGVGTVTGLPASEKGAKGLHIGDRRSGRFGDGGPKLSLHVGAGQIDVTSPDARKTAVMIEESNDSRADKFGVDEDSMEVDVDKTVQEATKGIDKEVAKALAQVQPELDKEMADLPRQIERALKEARPEIDRAMKEANGSAEQALKDLAPKLHRELGKIQPEIDRALREAMKTLKEATKDSGHIDAATQKALRDAIKAVHDAKKALHDQKDESPTLVELP